MSQNLTIKNEKYHYKTSSEDEASSSKMEETIPGTFDFINGHRGVVLNEELQIVWYE